MLTQEKQDRLTRVGPGAPMGRLLRCYWHPVCASVEVEPGKARAVRLLGEDLVVFRKPDGALGLVDRYCSHRRASLECGFVNENGIACPYHGWRFDADGSCVEMPFENANEALLKRASVASWPVEELGGLVFAYLGEAPAPLLPRYDVLVAPGRIRDIGYAMVPCNWLQIMENSVDPVHVEWLHGHHLNQERQSRQLAGSEKYMREHEEIGFDIFEYGIVKRRLVKGGSKQDEDWVSGHPLVFPLSLRVGAHFQHRMQIRVPVDDTHTLHFWYASYEIPEGKELPEQQEIPVYEVPWKDDEGNYIVDFVDGGDIMAWVSQGEIADRTREMLVASDQGVALLRKLYLEQIEKVDRGEDPMGVIRDHASNEVISFSQERNKLGGGIQFMRDAFELSHVRYSPLRDYLLALYDDADANPGGEPPDATR